MSIFDKLFNELESLHPVVAQQGISTIIDITKAKIFCGKYFAIKLLDHIKYICDLETRSIKLQIIFDYCSNKCTSKDDFL